MVYYCQLPDRGTERDHTLLRVGDVAPNFALKTVDGRSVSLQDALRSGRSTADEPVGRNVLLVFLRHLG